MVESEVMSAPRLSRSMLLHLASIWNVAHPPRKPGRAIVRCLKGGHHENAVAHDALLRRGLIRESSRNRYTRVTALGMLVLGVDSGRFRPLHVFREWPRNPFEVAALNDALRGANRRYRAALRKAK
jgi:hypothetical protein